MDNGLRDGDYVEAYSFRLGRKVKFLFDRKSQLSFLGNLADKPPKLTAIEEVKQNKRRNVGMFAMYRMAE